MTDAYRDDLAYIHDAGYGGLAGNAGPVVLAAMRARGLYQGRVVDLGCGSGILAATLSSAGYDVLGIDLSASLLALARQRAPRAQFQQGSLWSADIPPCVAVTAVGECFNYLFDTSTNAGALAPLFQRIYAALPPGGLFLFDVAEPGRTPPPGVVRAYTEGADWAVLVTMEEDGAARLLTRHITSFRQVGELYRRDHEVHRLRLLPRSEMAELLPRAGFQFETLAGYGELRFAQGHVGFLAFKP
jgi:SAM-dependent methyltransferase